MRGTGHVPMTAMDMSKVPEAVLTEFARRTGSKMMAVVDA
jgi:hypothetical protein